MRRPNYKVFVYHDYNSMLFDTIKVWAIDAQMAIRKAKEEIAKKRRDPEKFTFCAKGIA